jgi:hypothetical protein
MPRGESLLVVKTVIRKTANEKTTRGNKLCRGEFSAKEPGNKGSPANLRAGRRRTRNTL